MARNPVRVELEHCVSCLLQIVDHGDCTRPLVRMPFEYLVKEIGAEYSLDCRGEPAHLLPVCSAMMGPWAVEHPSHRAILLARLKTMYCMHQCFLLSLVTHHFSVIAYPCRRTLIRDGEPVMAAGSVKNKSIR